MKKVLIVLMCLISFNAISQYHFGKDLKYLIKTYPNGRYNADKNEFRVDQKYYSWFYYLDETDNYVYTITLFCFCVTEKEAENFEQIKNNFILKSTKIKTENGLEYLYDNLSGLTFIWRFIPQNRFDYENQQGIALKSAN